MTSEFALKQLALVARLFNSSHRDANTKAVSQLAFRRLERFILDVPEAVDTTDLETELLIAREAAESFRVLLEEEKIEHMVVAAEATSMRKSISVLKRRITNLEKQQKQPNTPPEG